MSQSNVATLSIPHSNSIKFYFLCQDNKNEKQEHTFNLEKFSEPF